MTTQTLGSVRMAKKKPGEPSAPRDRIDLRADPALVARLERQATRLGMSLSAYLRQAAIRQLEQDEATDPSLDEGS